MIIMSIDLGKDMGLSIWSKHQGVEYTEEFKFESLKQLHEKIQLLVTKWMPDLILMPYPTRFYYTVLKHGKMMGVIQLIAERGDIQTIEVQDATCKKVAIRDGEVGKTKKPEILKYYQDNGVTRKIGSESEHILDSIMFTQWYLFSTDQRDLWQY